MQGRQAEQKGFLLQSGSAPIRLGMLPIPQAQPALWGCGAVSILLAGAWTSGAPVDAVTVEALADWVVFQPGSNPPSNTCKVPRSALVSQLCPWLCHEQQYLSHMLLPSMAWSMAIFQKRSSAWAPGQGHCASPPCTVRWHAEAACAPHLAAVAVTMQSCMLNHAKTAAAWPLGLAKSRDQDMPPLTNLTSH